MRPTENLEQWIREFEIKPGENMRQEILSTLFTAQEEKNIIYSTTSANEIWRKIMRSKMVKIAAAIIVVTVLGLFIYLFDHGTKPVWAAQDTFKALNQIKSLVAEGTNWNGQRIILWLEVDHEGFIPRWRIEYPGFDHIMISTPEKSYQYSKVSNTVQILTGPLMSPHGWQIGSLFEDICKGHCQMKVIYRGIETVWVCTWPDNNMIVEIDPSTYLPLKLKMNGPVRSGLIFKEIDSIYYNIPLPENTFTFKVEKEMKILDQDHVSELLNDPNNGIKVQNMTDMQAAKYVSETYCKALVNEDMTLASKIYPGGHQKLLEYLTSQNANKILNYTVSEPRIESGCGYGPVVKCEVRLENGTGKRFNLIVKLFYLKDGKRGVIPGNWDTIENLK